MLIAPCGDQTQLSSFVFGTLRYLPSTISCRHSTREKFILHSSPARGGVSWWAYSASAFHGKAISTDQPRSVSLGSFSVPSTYTAVRNPGISQLLRAFPPWRYGLSRNRSH